MPMRRPRKKSFLDKIKEVAGEVASPPDPTPPASPYKEILVKALVTLDSADMVRRENAYARFDIKEADVTAYPNITDTLNSIGGPEAAIEYLRCSEAAEIKTLVRYWDVYTDDTRALIPFEAYCVAAKITKKKFMQLLMGEVCEQSDMESTLLASAMHPSIVQKTIDTALSDGYGAGEARKLLHQHRGFLPMPKNQQITINGNVKNDNRNQDNRQIANFKVGDLSKVNDKIGKAVDRFNESRLIERAPDAEIEAEFVE